MKKLRLLLVLVFFAGWIGSAAATPVLNTTDFFPDGTSYGTYSNSGSLLFISAGNNLGNASKLSYVESLVESELSLPSTFQLSITNSVTYTAYNGGRTGTWETLPPVGAISFYAVKAGNAFAMYEVLPAGSTGSWSTFDLWTSGLQGTGGNGGLTISHFTGYNASNPVPEPASMLLFGSGVVVFGGYLRRRLKKS